MHNLCPAHRTTSSCPVGRTQVVQVVSDPYDARVLLTEDPAVDVATPTGPMRMYVYRPLPAQGTKGNERFPGVVLYSEIFQRTAPIHRMAMMLCGHGLLVVVPEIFHDLEPAGSVLAYDKPGTDRGNHCKIAKPVSAYD